jgi:hypothetical protein
MWCAEQPCAINCSMSGKRVCPVPSEYHEYMRNNFHDIVRALIIWIQIAITWIHLRIIQLCTCCFANFLNLQRRLQTILNLIHRVTNLSNLLRFASLRILSRVEEQERNHLCLYFEDVVVQFFALWKSSLLCSIPFF